MILTLSPQSAALFVSIYWLCAIGAWHGGHQVAQKSTSQTSPALCSRVRGSPPAIGTIFLIGSYMLPAPIRQVTSTSTPSTPSVNVLVSSLNALTASFFSGGMEPLT